MDRLVFATTNQSKLKRFSRQLLKHNIQLLSLNDLNIILDIKEDGHSAIENAIIKAKACYDSTHIPTIGMDDTLYLENVPKQFQPGLYVRRVNGQILTDQQMIDYYSGLVNKYGHNGKLNCKWIYGLAFVNESGEYTYSWSKDNFYMVDKASAIVHPGYPLDSISKYKGINQYFTEVSDEDLEKIKVNEDDVINFIVNHMKGDNDE